MHMKRGRILRAGTVEATSLSGAPHRPSVRPRVVPASRLEAERAAHELLVAAKAQARAILADAERQASMAIEQQRAAFRARAEEEHCEALAKLDEHAQGIKREAARHAAEVARVVAESMFRARLETDEGLQRWVDAAISHMKAGRSLILEVAPEFTPRVKAIVARYDRPTRPLEVREQPDLRPGDIRVVSDVGMVDARVETVVGRLFALVDGAASS